MIKNSCHKQKGNLIAAAALIIAGLGALGVSIIGSLTHSSASSARILQLHQSQYLAHSASEYGLLQIKNNISVSNPTVYCNGVWKSTQSFGEGQFRFKCTQYTPSIITNTALTSTAMVIPVSSLTNVAPIGRVQIDSEKIDYGSTSTNSTICGSAPCLVVLKRAAANTTAAAHNINSVVSQSQLVLESEGAVPNLTSPDAKTTIQNAITATQLNYTNAWATGQDGAIYQLVSGGTWQKVSISPSTNREFNDVTCTSSNNCWAIGTGSTVYRFNGSNWSAYTGDSFGTGDPDSINLEAVSCTSANDCWIITDQDKVYRFNGSSWSFSQSFSRNLRDISCVMGSNFCVISANSGYVYQWDGSSWSSVSTPTFRHLYGVSCPTASACFAVGNNGAIIKMTGSSWSLESSPTNSDLLTISCADVNNCWAFGSNKTRNAHYQNGTWTTETIGISDKTLGNVDCVTYDECFLAANRYNSTYALIGKWNGVSWSDDQILAASAENLFSVTTDRTPSNVIIVKNIGWREVFNS